MRVVYPAKLWLATTFEFQTFTLTFSTSSGRAAKTTNKAAGLERSPSSWALRHAGPIAHFSSNFLPAFKLSKFKIALNTWK